MNTLHLFDIPVYRVSYDEWAAEVERYRAKVEPAARRFYPEGPEESRRRYVDMITNHNYTHGLPWEFNEVIAWVRLEWDGPAPVVKGYAYRLPQERIRRGFERSYKFEYEKVIECWFQAGDEPDEIADVIRTDLKEMTKPGRYSHFPGRHVDLAAFDAIAPHIDWPRLIGLRE